MASDTKNLHLNLLYLFPGELDSQKGLKHFKHCRTEQRTSSVGVRGVYQISSNYLETFCPGLLILTYVCLLVCVPEQVLVSTLIILLNAALSISYLVSITVFMTGTIRKPD